MKTLRIALVALVALALGVMASADAPANAETLLLTLDTPNPGSFGMFGESVALGDVNGEFVVTIEPEFIDGIDWWQFLSGPSPSSPMRIDVPSLDEPVTIYAEIAGPTSIEVSKTADFDGRFVSGTISITNVGENAAIIDAIADSLEIHFPNKRRFTPPPLPEGSTPNWFKVADVPIQKPGPIAAGETVNIDYTFDVCDASDFSGSNSMRNVVAVTLANKPDKAQKDTVVTRSESFKPVEPECWPPSP